MESERPPVELVGFTTKDCDSFTVVPMFPTAPRQFWSVQPGPKLAVVGVMPVGRMIPVSTRLIGTPPQARNTSYSSPPDCSMLDASMPPPEPSTRNRRVGSQASPTPSGEESACEALLASTQLSQRSPTPSPSRSNWSGFALA